MSLIPAESRNFPDLVGERHGYGKAKRSRRETQPPPEEETQEKTPPKAEVTATPRTKTGGNFLVSAKPVLPSSPDLAPFRNLFSAFLDEPFVDVTEPKSKTPQNPRPAETKSPEPEPEPVITPSVPVDPLILVPIALIPEPQPPPLPLATDIQSPASPPPLPAVPPPLPAIPPPLPAIPPPLPEIVQSSTMTPPPLPVNQVPAASSLRNVFDYLLSPVQTARPKPVVSRPRGFGAASQKSQARHSTTPARASLPPLPQRSVTQMRAKIEAQQTSPSVPNPPPAAGQPPLSFPNEGADLRPPSVETERPSFVQQEAPAPLVQSGPSVPVAPQPIAEPPPAPQLIAPQSPADFAPPEEMPTPLSIPPPVNLSEFFQQLHKMQQAEPQPAEEIPAPSPVPPALTSPEQFFQQLQTMPQAQPPAPEETVAPPSDPPMLSLQEQFFQQLQRMQQEQQAQQPPDADGQDYQRYEVESPGPQEQRDSAPGSLAKTERASKSKLTRFIAAEISAVILLAISVMTGISHTASSEILGSLLKVVAIMSVAVAAVIPIVFYGLPQRF